MTTPAEVLSQLLAQATFEQATLLMARHHTALRVCKERGWDINNLSVDQVMEIRKDPDWHAELNTVMLTLPAEVLEDPRERAAWERYQQLKREASA